MMTATGITTPRLRLRRATWDDLAAVHRLLAAPRAMRYWSTPEHQTMAQTEAWLAMMIGPDGRDSDDFLIEHNGAVIGKAGAWAIPEIGFLLHPDHWGQGLAHEAMSAVIPYLFRQHAMPALTADVDPRNAASLRLLARLGFQETHRVARTLQWRDEWCDSVYLALPRPGS